MKQPLNTKTKPQPCGTYVCTQCGGNAEIGYSNWSRVGIKQKIVGKDERLCRQCFKERTEQVVL